MKIIEDLKRYSEGSFIRAIYTIFLNSNFKMIFWYRVAHNCHKLHLGFISKIIMYFHKLVYAVDIDYRARIAGGLKIVHGIGIVIGKDVVIGSNVSIYKGVVLGGNEDKVRDVDGVKQTQPFIGNDVKLYSDSAVFGPCNIGDNSVIGAHTVITKDVPANTKVHAKFERIEVEICAK